MSTEPDRQDPSLGQELRHWGRSSLEDLADELRTAMVFLAAMVPAGAVGYLVGRWGRRRGRRFPTLTP